MYERFKMRAEGVGAEVHRFTTRREALDFTLKLLADAADTPDFSAVWAADTFLTGIDTAQLAGQIPGLSFNVSRESAASAAVGISEADWALADTGTLVTDQTAVTGRLASTLPPTHIALVGTGRILPDKLAVFSRITPGKSRYIAFITGPSRTADIERVLTIGVHGPKRLVIICTDELEGVAA